MNIFENKIIRNRMHLRLKVEHSVNKNIISKSKIYARMGSKEEIIDIAQSEMSY